MPRLEAMEVTQNKDNKQNAHALREDTLKWWWIFFKWLRHEISKEEKREGRKKAIFTYNMEVCIFVGCLEVLKYSQMALPQENPLIWEPPLQHMISYANVLFVPL